MDSTAPDGTRPAAGQEDPPLYEAEALRMLAPAGFGRAEARLYALLLRRPGGTARELAEQLSLPAWRVRSILGDLAGAGLLRRIPGRPECYLPAPPDAALEPLLTRQQEELRRSRELAAELAERVRQAAVPAGDGQETVELLAGRDEVAQRVQQLERAASTEILMFDRPQYYSTDSLVNPGEIAALAHGVRVRGVYAREALDYPGRMDHIRTMAQRGEQARVFSPLPLKLFIFDRHTALLPVRPLDTELAGACLLIRTSGLLDALQMLFELVWARATPICADPGRRAGVPEGAEAAEGELVSLLAAGFTDEATARKLGISRRTLQRRIQALMETLDARSRFQAGYQAGLSASPQCALTD